MKSKCRTIAIIPAYNEENSIAKVINETKKYVDLVIVGDDGSTDSTAQVAQKVGALVLRNHPNRGKGYILRRLLVASLKLGACIIVALDADGQHDPKDIPKLIEVLNNKKADISIGSRFNISKLGYKIPFYRYIGLIIINTLNKIFVDVIDTQSGFRAFNRKAAEILVNNMREYGFGTESEQLYIAKKYNLKVIEVPITIKYDVFKPSKKNPIIHGLEVIITIIKLILINIYRRFLIA